MKPNVRSFRQGRAHVFGGRLLLPMVQLINLSTRLARINLATALKVINLQRCNRTTSHPTFIRLLASQSPWDKRKETFARAKDRLAKAKEKQIVFIRENVFTLPNALSSIRIAMTPVLGYLVLNNQYLTSLVVFTVAGITDVLDGWIARNYPGQRSALGSFLDPMADKLLVATLFICLSQVQLVPWSLTSLIILRDFILVVAAVLIRYRTLPQPRRLSKFFDLSLATAEMKPSLISKFNTASQLSLVFASLSSPLVPDLITGNMLTALQILTAVTTLVSGLNYLSFSGYQKISSIRKGKRGKKE